MSAIDTGTTKVTKRFEWSKGNDPHASVEDLAFSTDGRRLAATGYGEVVCVWDLPRELEKARQGRTAAGTADEK